MKKGLLKENKVLKINLLYILSILPLIIYSYYKNGFLAFHNGFMSFFPSLQYLIIPIVIIALSYVFETYYYLVIKKDEDMHNVINSVVPFTNALCYLVCGPLDRLYITIPLIIVLDIIIKFIDTKFSINQIALFKCLLFVFLNLLGMYNNSNMYELNVSVNSNLTSYFIGNVVGEIGTTSILFSLIGFVILLFNKYYKKEIPIISILSYAIVCVIIYFCTDLNFKQILINTMASGFVFATIFVVPLSVATPVVKTGSMIYSLLFGILSAIIVNATNFYLGIYILILILSLLTPLFNKFKLAIA